jgi:hypothetical protein
MLNEAPSGSSSLDGPSRLSTHSSLLICPPSLPLSRGCKGESGGRTVDRPLSCAIDSCSHSGTGFVPCPRRGAQLGPESCWAAPRVHFTTL